VVDQATLAAGDRNDGEAPLKLPSHRHGVIMLTDGTKDGMHGLTKPEKLKET
jgi:hypothetical protein